VRCPWKRQSPDWCLWDSLGPHLARELLNTRSFCLLHLVAIIAWVMAYGIGANGGCAIQHACRMQAGFAAGEALDARRGSCNPIIRTLMNKSLPPFSKVGMTPLICLHAAQPSRLQQVCPSQGLGCTSVLQRVSLLLLVVAAVHTRCRCGKRIRHICWFAHPQAQMGDCNRSGEGAVLSLLLQHVQGSTVCVNAMQPTR
jgi:hypothetical protein